MPRSPPLSKRWSRPAFAPTALPPSLKLRRTAEALAKTGRRGRRRGATNRNEGTMPTMNVGIVAKSHLREAMPHLTEIESWLEARGVEPVFETATAALMPPNAKRRLADKTELVSRVELIV